MNSLFKHIKIARKFKSIHLSLAKRMLSDYLVNNPKYSFLKDLGLNEQNPGVFADHGRWFGDGQVRIYFSLIKNKNNSLGFCIFYL
jgi:hypothetical protein